MFNSVKLAEDVAGVLTEIYDKAKRLNPTLTPEMFVNNIIRDWLEPYKETEGIVTTKDSVTLRNNLKQAVELSGKTRTQIAKETGLNRHHLGRLINRGEGDTSIKTAILLAQALNYPTEKLIDLFYIDPMRR